MRAIICIVALFVGYGNVSGQSSKTIRTYGITKKTETVVKYKGDLEIARYIEEIEFYNAEGDWVEKFTYASGGELKLHEKRTYEDNEVIEEITIDANGSGIKEAKPPSYERVQYVYEKDDLMSETHLSEDGEVVERKDFVYNNLGDLVEEITKDAAGNLVERETIEYNNRGLKVVKRTFDMSDVLLEEKIYAYE